MTIIYKCPNGHTKSWSDPGGGCMVRARIVCPECKEWAVMQDYPPESLDVLKNMPAPRPDPKGFVVSEKVAAEAERLIQTDSKYKEILDDRINKD